MSTPSMSIIQGIFDVANTRQNAMTAGQNVVNNGLDGGISTLAQGVGTAAGTAFGGPLGGAIGNALGKFAGGALEKTLNKNQDNNGLNINAGSMAPMTLGVLQNIKALAAKKKAEGLFPSQEDPELRALATDFRRRKRAFQTGTALNSQQSNIQALNKQAINSAFNTGAGMAGINRLAQITNQAMTGLQDQALKGEMMYGQQEADVINRLAQTRLEKRLLQYNQAMADAAQMKTNANRNMNMGLMRALPINPTDPNNLPSSYPTNNQTASSIQPRQQTNYTQYFDDGTTNETNYNGETGR